MNKRTVLATLTPGLLGVLVSTAVWAAMPESLPIHWDEFGAVNGYAPRAVALFVFPVMGWLTSIIMYLAMRKAVRHSNVLDSVVAGTGLFCLGMQLLCIHAALHPAHCISIHMIFAMFGLALIGLGATMPHLRQNRWAGIRTPWTLRNEVNWKLTHDFARRSMGIAGGTIILMACVLPRPLMTWLSVAVILLSSLLPMGYSYLLHRVRKS